MKRRRNLIMALTLAAVLIMTAGGCGKANSTGPAAALSKAQEEAKDAAEAPAAGEAAVEAEAEEEVKEEVTAVSLAEDALLKAKDVTSYSSAMAFVFDCGVTVSDSGLSMTMDMLMQMSLNNDLTREPEAGHMTGTMSMTMAMGEDEDDRYTEAQDAEVYFVQQDGQMVRYGSTDGGETWFRSAAEEDAVSADALQEMTILQKIVSGELEAELAEDTETLNGREVYVIHTALKGDTLKEVFDDSASGAGDAILNEDVDWSGLEAPADIRIYKETGLPASVEIQMSSFGDLMLGSMVGSMDEVENVEMDVRQFDISISYDRFNEIGEITVPEEVINNAAEASAEEAEELFE